tara:strand:- start:4681 stop:4959 length:279 start_codon:yes stop_codon:yes gene_type:complete
MQLTTKQLIDLIKDIIEDDFDINPDEPLIGGNSLIDSMALVQVCIALEEKSLVEGFNFDWTSEKAMSSMNSIFRTPRTLVDEYNRQLEKNIK